MLWNFLREEQGQDLIEYTLLLAFIVIAAAALYLGAGEQIKSIWTKTNEQLTNAAQQASS